MTWLKHKMTISGIFHKQDFPHTSKLGKYTVYQELSSLKGEKQKDKHECLVLTYYLTVLFAMVQNKNVQ